MKSSMHASTYAVYLAEQEIRGAVRAAVASALPNASGIEVLKPRDDSLADRTTNICFKLARELKKNPHDLAVDLCKKLSKGAEFFSAPTPAGGYVNFFFTQKFYDEALRECLAEKEFGSSACGDGKKIVLEYSQPNVGKPFHVGHIRSTIIGDACSRMHSFTGWRVWRMNYLGDSGTQVAKLLLALDEFKDMPQVTDEKIMLSYYVRIHKEIEANPALAQKAREILEKLEAGDEKTVKKAVFLREKSYLAFQRNYDLLDVGFDEVIGESQFILQAKKQVEAALRDGIAKKEKDESVVAVLEPVLPNTILLRSNSTTLYLTRDLALADYKYAKQEFDESVVFTASEQNLHFKQLQEILRRLKKPYAPHYLHIGFGLISLKDSGRLSTREGKVVFLEDVINQVIEFAKQEIKPDKTRGEYTDEEKNEIARIVGVGSLKFGVLRVGAEKNIEFDLKKAVDFNGDTGAYVQYTAVRAKNILRKSGLKKIVVPKDACLQGAEKKLLLATAEFPQVVAHAALQPHALCDFLLKYAALFNSFYDKCPVLTAGEVEKKQRLAIVRSALTVLENGLALLGIKTPEKM